MSWHGKTGRTVDGVGFTTSRRGHLGSTGLAAVGVVIGGGLPLSATAAAFRPRMRRPPRRRAGQRAAISEIPGKNESSSCSANGRSWPRRRKACSTTTPRRSRNSTSATTGDSGRDEKSRRLEDHHRRRGQQEDRDHARRAEIEIQGGDAAHGAGMRRQRPCGVLAAGARQPVDQWRRRLRRMDRRAAGRGAEGRRAEAEREIHRALCRRPASLGRRQQADACRAACASKRRWTPTP